MPIKKKLTPKKWENYPTDNLEERGNKVVQSNFFENTVVIVSVVLILIGVFFLFVYLS